MQYLLGGILALLAAGFAFGWVRQRGSSSAGFTRSKARDALEAALPATTVRVDRDTVHASDESEPQSIELPPTANLRELIGLALAAVRLPGISGGQATWVAEWSSEDAAAVPIAVCAQQWMEPAFLMSPQLTAASRFGRPARPRLMFRYRCQDDPEVVFQALMRRPG